MKDTQLILRQQKISKMTTLMENELTFQHDGAPSHYVFVDSIGKWGPPKSSDVVDFFLWDLLKSRVYDFPFVWFCMQFL